MKNSKTNQPCMPVWKRCGAWLGLIPALAILCLAAVSRTESSPGYVESNAPQLDGSWEVTVTLHFADGSEFQIPVEALVSHAGGGVTIISDPSQLAPPPLGAPTTPFHGAWAKRGDQFAFTAKFFQYDAIAGGWAKSTLNEKVTMTGHDSYEGEGTIEGVLPDGTPFGYGVTTVATRIKPE